MKGDFVVLSVNLSHIGDCGGCTGPTQAQIYWNIMEKVAGKVLNMSGQTGAYGEMMEDGSKEK